MVFANKKEYQNVYLALDWVNIEQISQPKGSLDAISWFPLQGNFLFIYLFFCIVWIGLIWIWMTLIWLDYDRIIVN